MSQIDDQPRPFEPPPGRDKTDEEDEPEEEQEEPEQPN